VKDELLARRCQALKLVLSDVDGVMTDGTLLVFADGQEAKAFHVRDGYRIALAHATGLKTGVVSGRKSPSVERRAAELKMAVVRLGVADKRAAVTEIRAELGLGPEEIAYIGDDLNDLPAFAEVGLTAAPADAPFEVKNQAFMITEARGGQGCVREFLEAILRARGDWEKVLLDRGITLG